MNHWFVRQLAASALVMIGAASLLTAQGTQGTAAGRVTDAGTKQPISDVRVQVAGTGLVGVTNARGEYRITSIPAGQATLAFSRIGYKAERLRITIQGGQTTTLDQELREQQLNLAQVVVTGTAGNQERRAQAATVSSISAAQVAEQANITTVGEMLTARTPGVAINRSSGTAGTANQIRIRGASSISLSNTPLVFIDGVRVNETFTGPGVGGQSLDRLNLINPDDIESIEVVKGPAAATLYGADASVGVIQIITKKGKMGQQGFRQTLRYEYTNVDQNWTPPDNFGLCNTAALVAATSTNPLCRNQPLNTLVRDNPLVRTGAFQTGLNRILNWSGRGGGNNYSYFLSGGYDGNTGTLPQNEFNRYNGRVNFNFTPAPEWSIDANVNYTRSFARLPDNDNNIYGWLGGGLLGSPLSRSDAGVPSNDGWFGFARQNNAISAIENTQLTNRSLYGLTVQYNPTIWFTNKVTLGGDLLRDEVTRFFPRNAVGAYAAALNGGSNDQTRIGYERYTFDYLGNMRRTFFGREDLEANLSFGLQTISTRTETLSASGQGFVVNSNNTVGSAASSSGGQGYSEATQLGYLGQLQLGWKNRIFVQGAARVDQFSTFGGEAQAFFLPKVGASYVISEESWFKLPLVSNMRLRGAWGQTGRAPTPGASLTTFSAAPFVAGAASSSGVVPNNPGNDSLRAERGEELEFGVDWGMFRDRVNFELTWFDKVSRDLLLQQPLPPSLGFASFPFANIGRLRNRGLEFAVNAQMVRSKNFSWDLRYTMNTLENEVEALGRVSPFFVGNVGRVEVGLPAGAMVTKPILNINEQTGVVQVDTAFRSVNKPLPDFEAALWSSVKFGKYFTVTGSIDTKRGFGIYNLTDFFRETQLVRSDRRLDTLLLSRRERLRRYGNPTTGQPAFVQLSGVSTTVNEVREAYIQNADFVRFRELALTANLPTSWANRFKAQGGAITIAGTNLMLWTAYEGPDPEVLTAITSQFDRADFLTVPNPRRFTVRVNLTY